MPEPTEPPTSPRPATAGRWLAAAAALACFAAALLLMLTRVVGERITSDEQIFLGGAGLMARGEGLIYRDFFYTHLPAHALLLAGLFRLSDHWILTARLVDAACAAALVTLVFDAARRSLRDLPAALRLAGAAAVAVTFAFNPLTAYAGGIAWNHNLAALCCVAAILLLPAAGTPSTARVFASGALASLAATARLTFAPVLVVFPFFFVWTALALRRGRSRGRVGMPVLRWAVAWCVGAAIVALPSMLVCLESPAAAWFENVRYPGLTARFSADLGDNPRVTFAGKLAYVAAQYGKPTAAALILLAIAGAALALRESTRSRHRGTIALPHDGAAAAGGAPDREAASNPGRVRGERALPRREEIRASRAVGSLRLTCVGLATLIAFAAAFAATPMFRQYLYAPLPLAAIALALSLRLLRPTWRRAAAFALLPVAALCLIGGRREYRPLRPLLAPSAWTTTKWHADARTLRARVPAGKVLTLMPGLPLEAGLPIYPELSIGRYAARSAAYLTAEQRAAYRVPDLETMRGWFAGDPPAAVLVNEPPDTALEHRIADLAARAGYAREPMGPRWRLYLPRTNR